MTLNDLVKRIKRSSHRGDQAITTDQITTDIIAAINDSRRDVAKLVPKRNLWKQSTFSVVQGTSVYSLANDVLELIILRYVVSGADFYPRKVVSDREWYDSVWDSVSSQEDPKHYREIGLTSGGLKQIEFFRVPKQALTVTYEYYKDITKTELSSSDLSTEFPDFPSYIQDIIWKGGLYYFLKGFDDPLQEKAQEDFERAKLMYDMLDENDLDSDLQIRFGISNEGLRDPNTGIKLV